PSETNLADRLKAAFPKVVAVVVAPLAAILYVTYVELSGFGSIAQAYAQRFGWDARPPWVTVEELINKLLSGHANVIDFGQIIALFIIVLLGIRAIKALPLIYHLFLWPALTFIMIACDHLYPLNSMTRYALHFFPIFMVLGIVLVKRPRWRPLWIIGGVLLQV